ncbi:helix-turn-helix domain-containing protein [Streptomyces sp. TLI_146]|uniref:helix-turn-helix domain-containing protein n=1 Tax=Streptomyces sp. TLI_146 TaxID=1938858 RepID=UPI0015D61549|nr:helix-turn-helix transcriptional regulator [Streptomyces sp. TLI_146]
MTAVLEGEHAQVDLAELMARVRRVTEEVECYQAAAISDARARGMGWEEVGQAAFIAAVTARARWRTPEVARLFQRRRVQQASLGAESTPVVPAARQSVDEVASAKARGTRSLTGALTFLLRHSGLTIKEAAGRSELSASYVSRIMAGERVPTWPAVQALVQVLGGVPLDLYALWEAAQGVTRPSRPPLDEAVENLGAALRGAYLAAGCPPYEHVSALTDGVVDASIVEGALLGRVVPCWETTSALLSALQAPPGDVRGLWDDANYAFLVCLQMPLQDGPGPFSDLPSRPPFSPGPFRA